MDFKKDVIERSFDKPVVVDFWAEWCGPCRILGPVIEQLAQEQTDRWELVKVNTEEYQEIAQAYRIMSIPNVKLFRDGQVVAEFAGALPRHAIMEWLDEHIPDERKVALGTLIEQIKSGQATETQVAQLEEFVQVNPEIIEARVALAGHHVFNKPAEALALVESIKMGEKQFQDAEDVRTLATLMQLESDQSAVANLLVEAKEHLAVKNMEEAIQKLIDATTKDKSFQGDLPRKAAIAFFRTLGNSHPLSKNYRWKFDMALY